MADRVCSHAAVRAGAAAGAAAATLELIRFAFFGSHTLSARCGSGGCCGTFL